MRAILLFLLFVAGLSVLIAVFKAEQEGWVFDFPASARPSTKPLPVPWHNSAPLAIEGMDAAQREQSVTDCGNSYKIQAGDTLGSVALQCGVSLSDLLAANPLITNPNRVYTGQEIVIPVHDGRGGADPLSVEIPYPGDITAGSAVVVRAGGFPPDTPVRIGLGLSQDGFFILAQANTDSSGSLSVQVIIPAGIRGGQTAFILATSASIPTRQAISERFTLK